MGLAGYHSTIVGIAARYREVVRAAAGRPHAGPGGAAPVGNSTDLGTIERETIAQVLHECRWNRTRAAKRLGLTRTQLYLRLQKYGLEKPADA